MIDSMLHKHGYFVLVSSDAAIDVEDSDLENF
jgi:hypothetical protein